MKNLKLLLQPLSAIRVVVIWVGILLCANTNVHARAHGMADTRVNVEVDAPIVSLNNLVSIKQTDAKPLNYSPKIESFSTSAGTPVLFVQANQLPVVDLRITFNAGSARDTAIQSKRAGHKAYGLAALTAAMLTKGTHTRSEEELNKAIEQYGLSISSKSYKDMFVVSSRSLSDTKYVQKTTHIVADMLANATFPTQALERTRSQTLVAIKQANEKPALIARHAFFNALYGKHPYAHPTSGTLESLPKLTRSDLLAFKKKFLVAKNASIAITGHLSLAEAKQLAETLTQALPVGSQAPKLPTPKPHKAKHIHIPFDSTQTTFIFGQLGMARRSPLHYDLIIANDIFGGGDFNALLMRELRKKRGLTYGAYASFSPMQVTGPFSIGFSTRNDKANEALAVTQETLTKYLKNGATQEQIKDKKTSQINQFPLSIASNKSINGWLGMMAFYDMPKHYISNYTANLNLVSKSSANTAFARVIHPNDLLIITVGPKKPTR